MTEQSDKPGGQLPRAEVDLLTEATLAARRAPSVLNTQPWRWQLVGAAAELSADRDRQLSGLDPDGRLLMVSCGVALHHAITVLRAGGYDAAVTRLDDSRGPDLVARLRCGPRCTVEARGYRALYARRTDRRPFADTPPSAADLDALRAAAASHGVHLRTLTPQQIPAFAWSVSEARIREHVGAARAADLVAWTDRPGEFHDGVSSRSITPRGGRTVPPRDFDTSRPPRLALGEGTDRGTVYAILFTDGDRPSDWLAAGEALSDVWLTLTTRGLAASPISEVVEVHEVRASMRQLIGGAGHPVTALRIGVPVELADAPPPTERRAVSDVVDLPRMGRSG